MGDGWVGIVCILTGSICQFLRYLSSHDGRFQAKNGNLLTTELEEMTTELEVALRSTGSWLQDITPGCPLCAEPSDLSSVLDPPLGFQGLWVSWSSFSPAPLHSSMGPRSNGSHSELCIRLPLGAWKTPDAQASPQTN